MTQSPLAICSFISKNISSMIVPYWGQFPALELQLKIVDLSPIGSPCGRLFDITLYDLCSITHPWSLMNLRYVLISGWNGDPSYRIRRDPHARPVNMNVHIIHPVCLKFKIGPSEIQNEAYSCILEISVIKGEVPELEALLGVEKDTLQNLLVM